MPPAVRRKMRIKDVKTKQFLKNPERFADVFNVFLHEGKQVIRPEELEERNVEELLSLNYGVNNEEIVKQKWRDLINRAVVATANGTCYVLLGIENQSEIHYAMPVKNMIYDAINYGAQVEAARREHEKEYKKKGMKSYVDGGEFMSGFTRGDKITPIITLAVYWGSKEWDGPRTLHEMMNIKDESLLQYVPDYKINLLEPCKITDFTKFQTSVGEVLQVIKVSEDMNKMKEIMERNEAFRHLEIDAVRMLNLFTNLKIEIKEEEEEIDMCKAWDDWKAYNYDLGKSEGIEQTRVVNLRNIIKRLNYSTEQALQLLMIPEEEWGKYKELV